jgi:hypothetical protein
VVTLLADVPAEVPDPNAQADIRHSTLGILWSLGIGHSSFFSARPAHCFGVNGIISIIFAAILRKVGGCL